MQHLCVEFGYKTWNKSRSYHGCGVEYIILYLGLNGGLFTFHNYGAAVRVIIRRENFLAPRCQKTASGGKSASSSTGSGEYVH